MSSPYQKGALQNNLGRFQIIMKSPLTERLSNKDAAKYLHISVFTLNKMRQHGFGPAFIKLFGKIFYYKRDLDEFLKYHWRWINNFPSLAQEKYHYSFLQAEDKMFSFW
ncbi:MAG: hypothetical protein K0R24_432 [Gammaproteobacteria bacterium]|jgi:hypothetical protein|nr:hypothetical protein [Gammaproteobacteria bacterium]